MAMEAKPKEKRFVESSFATMVTMRARWFDGGLVRLGSKVWDRVLGPHHCVTLLYPGASMVTNEL